MNKKFWGKEICKKNLDQFNYSFFELLNQTESDVKD